ncbi:hypothetical protein ACFSYD_12825 [Paracoccus aerius]|nr:hypothetical protein [Paracoccus aerius]
MLIIGAVAVMAALGGGFWWAGQQTAQAAVDENTLCPVATGPVAMTSILLDLTDPLSPAQHSQLMAWLDEEIDRAPRGAQFTLGVVSEDPANWGATEPLCKPQDAASASALTQNVRLVGNRYREQFLAPLKANLEQMVSASGANSSPIMESLQALVSATPGFVTYEGPRRIVLVTDLLQHSDVLSFYRGGDWESFRNSADYERVGSTLTNAEVQVYQVPRPAEGIKDPHAVEDFWLRYFERQGAHAPGVKRLGDL